MLEEKLSGYLTAVGRAPWSVHSKVKGQVYTPHSFSPPTPVILRWAIGGQLVTDVLNSSVYHGFQVTASNIGKNNIFCYVCTFLIYLGLSCWKYRSTPTFTFHDILRHFQRLQKFGDVCFCGIFITFVSKTVIMELFAFRKGTDGV
jgi:hypothetical protein